MVYEFAPYTYKAYVKELYTSRGNNVLRDSPHDHLHHHALMYGIKVNGVNFWEEISGSGRAERGRARRNPSWARAAMACRRQYCTQDLVWVPAADAFLPLTNTPSAAERDPDADPDDR